MNRFFSRILALAFVVALFSTSAALHAQTLKQGGQEYSVNPQILADKILKEVEEIRGRPFKKPIAAQNQSMDDFEGYVDRELREQMPEDRVKNLGRIVQKLGLYRGPVIEDVIDMTKMVMKSQAAAYYDPKSETFYVLMSDMPPLMLRTIYAHELYHGLQDQYYDLDEYMLSQTRTLNDDELLARQAVVEGEATLIMTLWMLKSATGQEPDRSMLASAVNMQASMDTAMLRAAAKSNAVAEELGGSSMARTVEALDDIPPFMIETLMGAYTKGMKFVFEVQGLGWDKVDELYENPPVSTEQILYPKKWIAGEKPVKFEWPDFEEVRALRGWKLLDSNTLGEIQWRVIFDEHGMKSTSKKIAQGWNGDSYAVFERSGANRGSSNGNGESNTQTDSSDLLLLLATSWDSTDEAAEFARGYEELLKIKYADTPAETLVEQRGQEVFIVETPHESKLELADLIRMMSKMDVN
jgi:hypothetical protein